MAPIQLTPTRETLYSRMPERAGGYVEIVERFYGDQYGHQWHSFHRQFVFDEVEAALSDKSPATKDRPPSTQ